jgi:dolichol-phosphate mannosyltransferase
MDKAVVQDMKKCREQNRFVRGLMSWIGYKQIGICYDRPERKSGTTKYGFFKLLILSLDAMCGFSIVPLRIATLLGFTTLIISAVFVIAIIVHRLLFGLNIPGYALATAGMFFLGGVEMLLLGVIGEYVGRIYRQVQQRPLYLVREEGGWEENQDA